MQATALIPLQLVSRCVYLVGLFKPVTCVTVKGLTSSSTPYIDQKTDGGTVYKQILINAKLQTGQRGQKNRADWEKFIKETLKKETKVRIGL